jgi:hypothetical protein
MSLACSTDARASSKTVTRLLVPCFIKDKIEVVPAGTWAKAWKIVHTFVTRVVGAPPPCTAKRWWKKRKGGKTSRAGRPSRWSVPARGRRCGGGRRAALPDCACSLSRGGQRSTTAGCHRSLPWPRCEARRKRQPARQMRPSPRSPGWPCGRQAPRLRARVRRSLCLSVGRGSQEISFQKPSCKTSLLFPKFGFGGVADGGGTWPKQVQSNEYVVM